MTRRRMGALLWAALASTASLSSCGKDDKGETPLGGKSCNPDTYGIQPATPKVCVGESIAFVVEAYGNFAGFTSPLGNVSNAVWSAKVGTFSGSTYTAPSTPGSDVVDASFDVKGGQRCDAFTTVTVTACDGGVGGASGAGGADASAGNGGAAGASGAGGTGATAGAAGAGGSGGSAGQAGSGGTSGTGGQGGGSAGTAGQGGSSGSTGVPVGVFPVPGSLKKPEGLQLVGPGFGPNSAAQWSIAMTGTATVFVDLMTGGMVSYLMAGAGYGQLAFASNPDAVLVFGPNGGALTTWNTSTSDWGMLLIDPPPATSKTDATAIGGTQQTVGYTLTSFDDSRVTVNRWDANTTYWSDVSTVSSISPGKAISAYAHLPKATVMVLTDGQPGTLLIYDIAVDPPVAATVGQVGNSPRKLRCLPPLCAASNFASSTLSVVTWDGTANTAQIVGSTPVGDGPVGIDLAKIGTNTAAVSTGFNDNSYSVTLFDATGALVSNVKKNAPAGCTSPGHAAWAASGTRIAMTCNGSDSYAIVAYP